MSFIFLLVTGKPPVGSGQKENINSPGSWNKPVFGASNVSRANKNLGMLGLLSVYHLPILLYCIPFMHVFTLMFFCGSQLLSTTRTPMLGTSPPLVGAQRPNRQVSSTHCISYHGNITHKTNNSQFYFHAISCCPIHQCLGYFFTLNPFF